MGIKTFVLSLLFLSIGLLIATITFTPTKQSTKNKIMPTVTFIDSIMYDINNNEVTQLIKSKKAYHYKLLFYHSIFLLYFFWEVLRHPSFY